MIRASALGCSTKIIGHSYGASRLDQDSRSHNSTPRPARRLDCEPASMLDGSTASCQEKWLDGSTAR